MTGNNNFNIIRIYLSFSVLFFHLYALSQKSEISFFNRIFNGEKAVFTFFIISGYLISKSYKRSNSNKEFFIKRFKRIYPAYISVIFLCAALGFLVSDYSQSDYFKSPVLYKYILANSVFLNFLQPTLPGVFQGNYFPTVNGSLWSLKIEIGYYLLVPLLFFLRSKVKVHYLYAVLFIASVTYFLGMMHLYKATTNNIFLFLSRQTPGQLFYFILGAWASEIDDKTLFKRIISWLGLPCLVALFFPLGVVLESFVLAIVVFFIAFCIPAINYPMKREDISYGLYIYHFPVIQVLVYFHFFDNSIALSIALSVVITIVLAALSWFFIEKPSITKKLNWQLPALLRSKMKPGEL